MIHLIETPATPEQIEEMLEILGIYIKIAVDVERGILAGGGEWHADCEEVLLKSGSQQADIWGADWIPSTQTVRFESLINIRPRAGNRSMLIENPELRAQMAEIIHTLLGGI
jgi:hypothetical protein